MLAAPCNTNIALWISFGLRYPPRSPPRPKNNNNKEDDNGFIILLFVCWSNNVMMVNITFRAESQRSGTLQLVDDGEFASPTAPLIPVSWNDTNVHLNVPRTKLISFLVFLLSLDWPRKSKDAHWASRLYMTCNNAGMQSS
jgi:hypothetical protein